MLTIWVSLCWCGDSWARGSAGVRDQGQWKRDADPTSALPPAGACSEAGNRNTVSRTDHVERVVFTSILKSDPTSQNPESFTCDRMSDPDPVARTSISGRTPMDTAIGARIPDATAMATVADPMETRTVAASAHARTSGGMCVPIASVTAACAAPEARRTPLNPPAAARITRGPAMGPNESAVSRLKPPGTRYASSCTLPPRIAKATSAAMIIATSG